jgi:hypothetical protein
MRSPSIRYRALNAARHVRDELQPFAHSRWGCAPPIITLFQLRDWMRENLFDISLEAAGEEYEQYFLPLFDALAFITEGTLYGIVERMRINSAYALVAALLQSAKPEPKMKGRKKRSRS